MVSVSTTAASRLQTLYGAGAFELSIANRPTGGALVTDLAAVADRMTLRIVIVDDEPPARARLRRLLKAHDDVEIVAECGDGATAVQAIEAASPDLVLLDVQMPELDGFEVLRALDVPKMPAVIFVTAFDQYAVRAFEVHALDYVVKPRRTGPAGSRLVAGPGAPRRAGRLRLPDCCASWHVSGPI